MKWLDCGVFCGGAGVLVVGVGLYDVPAAMVVLGVVMMATVVAARIGAMKT